MKNDLKIFGVLVFILFIGLLKYVIGPKLSDAEEDKNLQNIANYLIAGTSLLKVENIASYDDSMRVVYSFSDTDHFENNEALLVQKLDGLFSQSACELLLKQAELDDYTLVVEVGSIYEKYFSRGKCL